MVIVATQLFDEESLETNEQMRSNIGGAENKLGRASKTYQVTGTTLESEAIAQVRATAPSVYLGLQRRTISIKRRDASDVYVVDVQYRIRTIAGSTDTVEPDPKFSFSTRGETQHITRSIATVSSWNNATNFRIGWIHGSAGRGHLHAADNILNHRLFSGSENYHGLQAHFGFHVQ